MARPKGSKTSKPNAYAGRADSIRKKYGVDVFRRWGKKGGNPNLIGGSR